MANVVVTKRANNIDSYIEVSSIVYTGCPNPTVWFFL